jgi:hypothetical protein
MGGTLLDTSTPNPARAYDHLLGGREAFEADREMVARLTALYPPGVPGPAELAAANRTYLELAVQRAMEAGAEQVLDLGAGFPAKRPLHEAAREVRPDAPVAYLDIDPRVAGHGVAATAGIPGVTYACGDLTRPGEVMANPDVRAVIDPGQPIAVVLGLVLHFSDAVDAQQTVAGWVSWLPPESRIIVTVAHWNDPELWSGVRDVYAPGRLFNHAPQQVAEIFQGLTLLSKDIEVARGWGPECLESSAPACVLGGVGKV